MHLLRKVDRAGVFEFGPESAEEALVAMTGLPLEIVTVGLRRLLDRGSILQTEGALVLPKFIEAQEANQTDAQRQREYRARRRDLASKKKLDEGRLNEPEKLFVYFLRSTQTQDIKIGISSRVQRRIAELQHAHGAAIELLVQFESASAAAVEAELHSRFEKYRKPFGEWFLPATEIMEVANGYAKMTGSSGLLCGAPVTQRDDVNSEPQQSRTVTSPSVTARDRKPSRDVMDYPAPVTPRSHSTQESEQNVTPSLAVPCLAVPNSDPAAKAAASDAGARNAPAVAASAPSETKDPEERFAPEPGLPGRPVRRPELLVKPVTGETYVPLPEHEAYALARGLSHSEYETALIQLRAHPTFRGYAPPAKWDDRFCSFIDSAALLLKKKSVAVPAPSSAANGDGSHPTIDRLFARAKRELT
jgi:hypothetical protein